MQLVVNKTAHSKKAKFQELLDTVRQRSIQPEDEYEIAAILESVGWNDSMAREVFGVDDVFELATSIYDSIQEKMLFQTASTIENISPLKYFLTVARSFLRGTIFALPMAISVVSMLTLRFSLWSYQYLSLENATSIAIGTVLSFMAVGGFTQAIARMGFLYLGQGQYYTARKVAFHFVKIGFITCLLMAVFLFLFCTVFVLFPWRMTLIAILYFLFLSAIWLSVTIMYMLQKELVFTGLLTSGIVLVFVLFKLVQLDIILSQIIALTFVSLAAIILAYYYFKWAERKMESGIAPPMPRLSTMIYTSLPFFLYGFFYFTFLFCDRVAAWSANSIYMPYPIWFRGEYELGLDIALLVLILPMGLVEVVVNEIMTKIEFDQKDTRIDDAKLLNKKYVYFYFKRLAFVILFTLANAVVLYFVVKFVSQNDIAELKVLSSGTTQFVYIWAVIGYSLVAVSLMNSLILLCLAQPGPVCRSVLFSLVANMTIGFLLTRWVDYSWAVLGLFAGALVFASLTFRFVLKVLSNLDYYLYAAS